MITFYLQRDIDESGVSGTGKVAEGVIFTDGSCALRWLTETASTGLYDNIVELEQIHGHNGKTKVVIEPDYKYKWEELKYEEDNHCFGCDCED